MQSEYSEENLEFWLRCEDYRKTKSAHKLGPQARRIYSEFISVQAAKEVGDLAKTDGLMDGVGGARSGRSWLPKSPHVDHHPLITAVSPESPWVVRHEKEQKL